MPAPVHVSTGNTYPDTNPGQ
ncbi:hypothetical protein KIPB_017034, partial [Kipferlia bialata]|eukprot:g17034.t1